MKKAIRDRDGAMAHVDVAHEDVAPSLPSLTSSAVRSANRDNKMINPVQGIDTGTE